MEQKSAREIQKELAQPFAPEDLEWRLQRVIKPNKDREPYGIAVPYVTNRAIMSRLDNVVGVENWYNDYKPWHQFTAKVKNDDDSGKYMDKQVVSQICGIAIYFAERDMWITKWDGAEDTDIEPVKGGLSDSMKRAAVQWGIGRVLYNMDTVFVDVEHRGRSYLIPKEERQRLDKAYLDLLDKLHLKPAPALGIEPLLVPQEQSGNDRKPETQGKTSETRRNAETAAPAAQNEKKTRGTPAIPQVTTNETKTRDKLVGFPQQEEPTYAVLSSKVQSNMTSSSTRVVLQDAQNKRYNAFVRGEHPALVSGAVLGGVKLKYQKQDMVEFYILEAYRVVGMNEVPAA